MVFNRIQIVKQQGLFGLNSSREINYLMPRFFCHAGVLSKRDGRGGELDVDGVARPLVAGKGDRQLGATDGRAPVFYDDWRVVGICNLITGGGGGEGGTDFLACFGREETSSSSLSSVPDLYRGFGL